MPCQARFLELEFFSRKLTTYKTDASTFVTSSTPVERHFSLVPVARYECPAVGLKMRHTIRPRAEPEKQFASARHLLTDAPANVVSVERESHVRLQRRLRLRNVN